MADQPGASKILLNHVGPGTWVSPDFVDRGGGNAVIIELIPDGPGNADLVTLDSAVSGTGYSAAVDSRGTIAGVAAYSKIQVSTVLQYVKVQLTVNAGIWSIRVTPVDAGAQLITSVTGDVNLAELGGNPIGAGNPVPTYVVSSLPAGSNNIGDVDEAAVSAAVSDVAAPAVNTAAVVNYGAVAGQRHVITGIAWSYAGGVPAGGNLRVEDGAGNVVFNMDIAVQDSRVVTFPKPKKGSVNTAMIVTLAAGGAAVTGKISVLNHYTEA